MDTIDIGQVERFLSRFDYETVTLQIQPVNGKWVNKDTKLLATGKSGSSVYCFNDLHKEHDLISDLNKLQKDYATYFMVNEGDGETHEPAKTPRSGQSVTNFKACFVDTDEGDVNELIKFTKERGIKPHLIVLSSKTAEHKKYHVYFLLKPTTRSKENDDKWTAIQNKLASLHPGFDPSAKDLPRVLRIPGTYHTKDKKTFTKVTLTNEYDHEPYSLDELYTALEADTIPSSDRNSSYTLPLEFVDVKESERHYFLISKAKQISHHCNSPEEIVVHLEAIVKNKFENPEVFLQNGERHGELIRCAKSGWEYRMQDLNLEKTKESTLEILLDDARKQMEATKTKDENLFALPEEVFLNAPDILGEITREINAGCRHPMPPASFCAALTILASVKGAFYTSNLGDWCSLYSLVLAPSGAGKDDPQKYVKTVLKELGLGKVLGGKINSARTVIEKMKSSGGQGTFIFDEINHFISSIQEEGYNSQAHMNELCDLMLSLFSSTGGLYVDGATSTRKEIHIDNLCINLMGTSVIKSFNSMFSPKSITSGLLPRMLIFTHKQKAKRNPNRTTDFTLSPKLMGKLRELAAVQVDYRTPQERIAQIRVEMEAILELPNDATEDDQKHRAKIVGEYSEQIANIEADIKKGKNYLSEARKIVYYTEEAENYFNDFEDKMFDKERELAKRKDGTESVIARSYQMAGRIALAGVSGEITLEMIEYTTSLMEMVTNGLLTLCDEHMEHPISEAETKVYNKLVELFVKSRKPVSKRYLQQMTPEKGTGFSFGQIYKSMAEAGTYFEVGTKGRKILLTPIMEENE